MRSVDVAGRPCLLDGGQGPQRAGVAQALAGDLDRHPLLPGQPGGAGLGARGAPGALRIPARQHPGVGRVEATAQALHGQHGVRQGVVIEAVEVDGVQLGEHRRGPVEHVGHISSHGTPLRGPSAADRARGRSQMTGTVTSVPRGEHHQHIEHTFVRQPGAQIFSWPDRYLRRGRIAATHDHRQQCG